MIERFKYFCQKVLPLVYDDSLSYYEVLCKVSAKLNEVIDQVNGVVEESEEINADSKNTLAEARRIVADVENQLTVLEQEIDELLSDLSPAIIDVIEQMIASGEFDEVIGESFESAVNTKPYTYNDSAHVDFAFGNYNDDYTSTNYEDWDWGQNGTGKMVDVNSDVYVCVESIMISGTPTVSALNLPSLDGTKYALVEVDISNSSSPTWMRVPYNCVSETGVFPIPPFSAPEPDTVSSFMLHFVKVS